MHPHTHCRAIYNSQDIETNNLSFHQWIEKLLCVCVYIQLCTVLVNQPCLTLCDPMNCGPPSTFARGILQATILEWVAIPFSRRSSQTRDQSWVSLTAGRFFIPPEPPYSVIKKNETLPFATAWMDLKGIVLSEISQTKTNTVWSLIHRILNMKKRKFTDTENIIGCQRW